MRPPGSRADDSPDPFETGLPPCGRLKTCPKRFVELRRSLVEDGGATDRNAAQPRRRDARIPRTERARQLLAKTRTTLARGPTSRSAVAAGSPDAPTQLTRPERAAPTSRRPARRQIRADTQRPA